jgi:hypothetical protein
VKFRPVLAARETESSRDSAILGKQSPIEFNDTNFKTLSFFQELTICPIKLLVTLFNTSHKYTFANLI